MYRLLVVWYNPNKKTYYYKIVWGFYAKYYIGYKNQYGHEVVLIINNISFRIARPPLRKRVLMHLINFLQRKL